MKLERKFELLSFVLVALLASWPVQAGKFFTDFQILGQIGSERFRWTDYTVLGNEVAKESGTRPSASISANNFFRPMSGVIYGAEIESSDGDGDYYGDAWTGIVVPPAQVATTNARTRSGYTRAGVHGGVRYTTGPFGFNALAGVVSENRDRTIRNGTSTTGTLTYGHDENISISSFRLTGGIDLTFARLRVSLVAGPIFASGTRSVTLNVPTSDDSFEVDLRFKYAYFAALTTSLALDEPGHHRLELDFYRNDVKTKPDADVYVSPRGTAYLQPGAEISSSGVRLGYGYKF